MKPENGLTMAIYPNSIGFGYAIVKSPREPIACSVVRVLPIDNKKCLDRIKKFINKYQPTLIILQELEGKYSHKSPRVKLLLRSIRLLANYLKIPVTLYAREEIRLVFGSFKGAPKSKFEIAQKIGVFLPHFRHRLPKKRKEWDAEDYNMGLFDALSLMITHFDLNN